MRESVWRRLTAFLHQALLRLRVRRDTGQIETVDALAAFAHTRAAFVAQKKLFGYLKARMGIRYPSMFEDETFSDSINLAKRHVFLACLSDITIHVVGNVTAQVQFERDEAEELCTRCIEAGLAANAHDLPDEDMLAAFREAFSQRLEGVHWSAMKGAIDCFVESPKALYRWAPIDEALKRYDREIVENSIRFAWAEIIRDFRSRCDAAKIAADLRKPLETAVAG